jgi:hypothetical protein
MKMRSSNAWLFIWETNLETCSFSGMNLLAQRLGRRAHDLCQNVSEQSNTLEMAIKLIEEKNIAGKPRYSRDSATPHAKLRE